MGHVLVVNYHTKFKRFQIEIEADIILKGTRVDGIYSADPEKDSKAKKFDKLSFDKAYDLGLKVMDLTAFTLCKENKLPINVFNMNVEGNLKKISSSSQGRSSY